MGFIKFVLVFFVLLSQIFSSKDRCGKEYGNCDDGDCCSEYNWCGDSEEHCGKGCQSKFGICKSTQEEEEERNEDDEFEPGTGKIEWVWFSFSEGGVKDKRNYGEIWICQQDEEKF